MTCRIPLALLLLLTPLACGDDSSTDSSTADATMGSDSTSTDGDGDGDSGDEAGDSDSTTGDGDGEPGDSNTDSAGDGDGDDTGNPTTTGDGDGDAPGACGELDEQGGCPEGCIAQMGQAYTETADGWCLGVDPIPLFCVGAREPCLPATETVCSGEEVYVAWSLCNLPAGWVSCDPPADAVECE